MNCMAAFLTTQLSNVLDWIIDYSKNSPIDHPADAEIVRKISQEFYSVLGYSRPSDLADAMRDRPCNTLLKAIRFLNDPSTQPVTPPATPTLSVAHAPDGDPESPFPIATIVAGGAVVAGHTFSLERATAADFSDAAVIATVDVAASVQFQDFGAFLPAAYYYRVREKSSVFGNYSATSVYNVA